MTYAVSRRGLLIGGIAAGIGMRFIGRANSAEPLRAPPQRIALIIGNASYRFEGCLDKRCELNSPVRDALAVEGMFRKLGFETAILTDATYEAMEYALGAFQRRASIADVAALYYSGHGIQIDGFNYLIPVDGSIPTGGEPVLIQNACVPLEWGSTAIGGANRLGLMLIDACRENPYLSAIRKKDPNDPRAQFSASLTAIDPPNDFFVGFATKGGQLARDAIAGDMSPYAKAIVKYLGDPHSSVEYALRQISTSVCDLTSPSREEDMPHADCQQPVVYGVMGAEPRYIIDDNSAMDAKAQGKIIANLKTASPLDPAVRSVLGSQRDFSFQYVLNESDPDQLRIYPGIEYFTSKHDGRLRPFFVAADVGYLAPEEGATGSWSLSYPLIDLIARRLVREPITIDEIVFETIESKIDDTPYISAAVEMLKPFSITFVNQSDFERVHLRLEFDVIGFTPKTGEDFSRETEKRSHGYAHTVEVVMVGESFNLDLREWIAPKLPDFVYWQLVDECAFETDAEGRIIAAYKKVDESTPFPVDFQYVHVPEGFADWYAEDFESESDLEQFWVIGRITSTGIDGQSAEADFAAAIYIYNGGVGGGAIEYDFLQSVHLPIDGAAHRIAMPVGLTLNTDRKAYRGLYPLIAERSSHHKLKISLVGDGSTLFESQWINTHIYVSRLDKRVEEELARLPGDPFD